MGTITIILSLVFGLFILMVKAMVSGATKAASYTREQVSNASAWADAQVVEGVKSTRPVAAVRRELASSEENARLFIEIMKQNRGDK